MITNYTLDWSDPSKTPITVIGETKNASATSLVLSGKGTPNWGEPLQENLLKMMEHFASPTAPAMPTVGQIWYDTATQLLKLRLSTNVWEPIWPNKDVIISATAPVGPTTGLLWYDTTANQLKLYTIASVWSIVWPIVIPEEVIKSPTAPSPTVGLLWHDLTNNQLKIYDTTGVWQRVWPPVASGGGVYATNPAILIGGGICVPIGPAAYTNGVAIMRARDYVSEVGSVAVSPGSNPPTYLSYTYTNATATQQLVEATLMGSGNAYFGAAGSAIGFTYNISETLGINMPSGLQTSLDPGTIRQTIEVVGLNTRGGGGGTDQYHEESVGGAVFTKILAPGQSVTIYSQWWVTLYQNKPLPLYTVIHGNMSMKVKVYNNGAYL